MLALHYQKSSFEKIKETFETYFDSWNILFPKELYEAGMEDEMMSNGGWMIQYSVDFDQESNPIFYVAADHRMTNPRRFAILHTGEIKQLASIQEGYGYSREIEGDKEEKQRRYFIKNRQAHAQHCLIGLSLPNLEYRKTSHDIYKNPVQPQIEFRDSASFLHPDYPATFTHKGRTFASASHCYNFYKISKLGLIEMPEKDRIAVAGEFDFSQEIDAYLRKRKNIHEKNVDRKGWLNFRENFLFEIQVKKFFSKPDLQMKLLEACGKEIIFQSNLPFWGQNNRLGVNLAYTSFVLYYLQQDPKALI
ncbi:MAG: hypothetical protein AAF587_34280 [Bacteroidota bacterium]